MTRLAPKADRADDLSLAFVTAGFASSNAVVVVADGATAGVGCGQTSRVSAARIAMESARRRLDELSASSARLSAGSDGFFPFPDGLAILLEGGVDAIIQPGGSKRDGEVSALADRFGASMVATAERRFSH